MDFWPILSQANSSPVRESEHSVIFNMFLFLINRKKFIVQHQYFHLSQMFISMMSEQYTNNSFCSPKKQILLERPSHQP